MRSWTLALAVGLIIGASASVMRADGADPQIRRPPLQLRLSVKRILPADGDYVARWSNARIRTIVRLASRLLTDRAGISLRVLEVVNVTDPGIPGSWWAVRESPGLLEHAARTGVADLAWRDDAVNVYLVESLYVPGFGAAGGVCSYPPDGEIVMMSDGGAEEWQAVTLAHELGHYTGLHHTHDAVNGVDDPIPCQPVSPACEEKGDLVCDTPPDPQDLTLLESLYGPTCDGIDPDALDRVRGNLMSYYNTKLRLVVTPGQVERMRTHVDRYREHVLERRPGRQIPAMLSRARPAPACLAQCRSTCPAGCNGPSVCAEETRDCLDDCHGHRKCRRYCRLTHDACLAGCRSAFQSCLADCRGFGGAVCARRCRKQNRDCSTRRSCNCPDECRERCDLEPVAAR